MKLGLITIISTVSAGYNYFKAPRKGTDTRGHGYGRKHPSKVLSNANKMFCMKVAKQFKNKAAGERTCSRFTNMATDFNGRLERRRCTYYNPLVKGGGPNPDPQSVGARWIEGDGTRSGYWRPYRNRRDAADGSGDDDDYDYYNDYYGVINGCEELPEDSDMGSFCDTEYEYEWETVDVPCEGNECLLRKKSKKKKKVKKVKLNRTERTLKKSLVTMTAWCARHFRDCGGYRRNKQCIARVKGLWKAIRPKLNGYKALQEGQKAPTL